MSLRRAALQLCACLALVIFASAAFAAEDAALKSALEKLRAVGPKAAGHADAVAAAKTASQAPAEQLPVILAAMDGVNPVAENWLRGVAEAVAQRATSGDNKLPQRDLEAFLLETKHSPRARRLSYELIAAVDPTAESRIVPKLLNDPSVELRRDAVAQVLAEAARLAAESKEAAIKKYEVAFYHARDLDQIKDAAAKLREAEQQVDLATHMGYVMKWKLIGPFDNVDDKGWDVAYPPEAKVDLAAELDGQKGKVKWIDHTTADDYGVVDLNKIQGNHKGAITYAYAEFLADKAQPCELRLGCINANKVWLNGKLLTANHVYHANTSIDQYIAPGALVKGKNTILLKICQNEQTEAWAQNWQFQLRVCDAVGTAILSQDRATQKVASVR
jgi:hypothetical protein